LPLAKKEEDEGNLKNLLAGVFPVSDQGNLPLRSHFEKGGFWGISFAAG
jgi:hypothetical protein